MNEPHANPELEFILDACLVDILRGEQTITGCLEQYPHYAEELKPALEVAVLTARLKSPEMPSASVDALEQRLLQQAQTQYPARVIRPQFRQWSKLAAMIGITLLCLLGAGGGTVAASANTVPGDTLYGIKRLWESIILLLTPLTGQLDDLWLRLAETRLYEAEQLALRGELSDEALIELYYAMSQSILLADAETTPQVVLYLGQARTQLAAIAAPAEISGIYNQVVNLTEARRDPAGKLQPPPAALETSVPTPTATLSPTATQTLMPSPTATAMPSVTPQPSATQPAAEALTPSPRVPATATRTPTLTVSPTATFTPSMTPTQTWTPLPLPVLPTLEPNDSGSGANPGNGSPGAQPTASGGTDDEGAIRFRETQQSVFLTQTAQPPPTTAP